MTSMKQATDQLVHAIRNQQAGVRITGFSGSLEKAIMNALAADRRLMMYLGGYQASYQKMGGMLNPMADYDVTLEYQENIPPKIDDVVIFDPTWDPVKLYRGKLPDIVYMVTDDVKAAEQKISEALDPLMAANEGLHGWSFETMAFDKLTRDTAMRLTFQFYKPLPELRQLQAKARFAAKNIWRDILKRAVVPAFVKPFLAFSYLAQEGHYDDVVLDEVRRTGDSTNVIPHLAYGPLVEKNGVCDGYAWAFKTLMDEAGIECSCVTGFLKDDMSLGHMWNLVKIDGQYYHVDVTTSIKSPGVHVSWLMQPDNMMRPSHQWDETKFPPARGARLGYDYLEDYLADEGGAFLDDGANEKYMFPDEIYD